MGVENEPGNAGNASADAAPEGAELREPAGAELGESEVSPAEPAKRRRAKKAGKRKPPARRKTDSKLKRLASSVTFDRVVQRICRNIAMGMSETKAVIAAGLPDRTHRRWKTMSLEAQKLLEEGQPLSEEQELLLTYEPRLDGAASKGLESLMLDYRKTMKEADAGDRLKGMQWLLTHSPMFRDEFGPPPQKLEHSGPEGKPMQTQHLGPVIMVPPEVEEE